jgi:hypothetical protein
MTLVPSAAVLTGLVIFFISLPLICRKVPMNSYYGFRIRAAFESRQSWYDINAYGGRQFARWSFLIILSGLAGFFVPERHFALYAWLTLAVSLTAMLVPIIRVVRWSSHGGQSGGDR